MKVSSNQKLEPRGISHSRAIAAANKKESVMLSQRSESLDASGERVTKSDYEAEAPTAGTGKKEYPGRPRQARDFSGRQRSSRERDASPYREFDSPASILRDGGVNLIAPGQDSATQILDLAEPRFAQEVHNLTASLSALAVNHEFVRGI